MMVLVLAVIALVVTVFGRDKIMAKYKYSIVARPFHDFSASQILEKYEKLLFIPGQFSEYS